MRTKLILTALCAVAAASVCFGGEVRYVLVDGVVVANGGTIAQRDLLVAEGIRTAVVDRCDDVTRGSRRPAPEGPPAHRQRPGSAGLYSSVLSQTQGFALRFV